MSKYDKKNHTSDDAAMIAPDNWTKTNTFELEERKTLPEVFTYPDTKDFYCNLEKKHLALISSDIYFNMGLRILLENAKNLVLHIYNNAIDFNKSITTNFDVVVFSATKIEDIHALYRLTISSRLNDTPPIIITIADNNTKKAVTDITKNLSGIILVSAHESPSAIKSEILKRLRKKEEKEISFPDTLTPRQADILTMTANGLSVDDISFMKKITPSTIYAIKAQALEKAGATNKVLEAILYSEVQRVNVLERIC